MLGRLIEFSETTSPGGTFWKFPFQTIAVGWIKASTLGPSAWRIWMLGQHLQCWWPPLIGRSQGIFGGFNSSCNWMLRWKWRFAPIFGPDKGKHDTWMSFWMIDALFVINWHQLISTISFFWLASFGMSIVATWSLSYHLSFFSTRIFFPQQQNLLWGL